jgi:hypothetical protein
MAGVPSLEDLNKLPDDSQYKKSLIQMRNAIEQTFKPQLAEIQGKYQPYEPIVGRFEQPEQLQSVLDLHDQLIGWERDAATHQLVPATEAGVQRLAELYPQHADFIAADLLNGQTRDPETGELATRMDIALKGIASDPTRRAEALRLLGAVEPTSISPQWQATDEELANVREDLRDVYRNLSYEDRQELKLSAPDFINRQLEREKLTQELQAERQAAQQTAIQQQQAREQYIAQQAAAAGESHLQSQLSTALTTFHEAVVNECDFIKPLDPASPPEGMDAASVAAMNAQIAASNKAEAAQITLAVVGLINPQTRGYVLPLLKEIGAVDDKLLAEMEQAAGSLGNNARNYGELAYRGKLSANGNGFQPDASMAGLDNEAKRSLNKLVYFANRVKANLMEKRSAAFSMKATDHNQTLTGVTGTRPAPQGGSFDPGTATSTQRPAGPMTRKEIDALYG